MKMFIAKRHDGNCVLRPWLEVPECSRARGNAVFPVHSRIPDCLPLCEISRVSDLRVSGDSESLMATWEAPALYDQFSVELRKGDDIISSTTTSEKTYSQRGLDTEETYCVTVAGLCNDGTQGVASTECIDLRRQCDHPPDFTLTAVDCLTSKFSLDSPWPLPGQQYPYSVYMKDDLIWSGVLKGSTVDPPQTEYPFITFSSTLYTVAIHTQCENSAVSHAAIETIETPECPGDCDKLSIRNHNVTFVSSDTISLSWDPSDVRFKWYNVSIREQGKAVGNARVDRKDCIPSCSTTFRDLKPGTEYTITIMPFCDEHFHGMGTTIYQMTHSDGGCAGERIEPGRFKPKFNGSPLYSEDQVQVSIDWIEKPEIEQYELKFLQEGRILKQIMPANPAAYIISTRSGLDLAQPIEVRSISRGYAD